MNDDVFSRENSVGIDQTKNDLNRSLPPGTRVRLKDDPGRQGVVTGKTKTKAVSLYLQVVFPDGPEFHRDVHLEIIEDDNDDPTELLLKGKVGRARDLRGNITHIRLTGRLDNLIYSMDTTNTDFYPYQFKPVLNFLDSPGNGLLIADEVGLGKTIEAGLIWTELRSRFDIRRVVVLCPAMLREKWRDELSKRFGIEATISNAGEVLERLSEYRSGERQDFALICSMQGLRPRRGGGRDDKRQNASSSLFRLLKESEYADPLLDLLIVDEAHYLRNPESKTSRLGRRLRAVSEHVVLLSATPVHLRSADLFQLLNLVDEGTFNQPHVFDEILRANEPLIRARDAILAGTITQADFIDLLKISKATPYFERSRQIGDLLENPPSDVDLENRELRTALADQLDAINLLGRVVNRTRKRDVTEWRVVREVVAEMIPMAPVERRFYEQVTDLVRDFASRYNGPEGFLLATPQRQMTSCMVAALGAWMMHANVSEEQVFEDLGIDEVTVRREIGPLIQELMQYAVGFVDIGELRQNDSKYARLKTMLTTYLNRNPGEKVVLFAYFRPTLGYLRKRLEEDGISCIVLTGGQGADKQSTIDRFQRPDGPSVLLSSEVASEGVDLQFSRVVINYDLPWNPMKVEQRIGRIDRLGQKSPVITIWNLFYEGTIDQRIYTRLYERLKIFERALGGLEAVLGEKIRELTEDLLAGKLTPVQEEIRIDQTEQAISNLLALERQLEEEAADLVAHGDYILNKIRSARELQRNITGEDLWNYVHDFFKKEYTGSEFVQINEKEPLFDVKLSDMAKIHLGRFLDDFHLRGQTALSAPYPPSVRCRFLNQVDNRVPGRVETINHHHPLVRFVSNRIENLNFRYYSPVSVKISCDQIPEVAKGIYAFLVEHWSIKGIRDIERLFVVVTELGRDLQLLREETAEKLITIAARHGRDWMRPDQSVDLQKAVLEIERCQDHAERAYEFFVKRIEAENNDRADVQERALKQHLGRQIEKIDTIIEKVGENERVARMWRGRRDATISRVEQKIVEINENRRLKHRKREICIGLVSVS